jgi:hypothetical protein
MTHYYHDDEEDEVPDDLGWGPIIVRRPVYNQGMKMVEGARTEDGPAFETARGLAQDCRLAGEDEKAAFWTEVQKFLEWREAVREGTETVVLEEGEEWDSEARKKVRRRGRRRHSGKGT